MKTYCVGGAVRDELLGLPVSDHDWVVVGATPEEMVARGFHPVGKDFPVFLHPETREEHALARTERKTARGYRGFRVHYAPDVTLEQDLRRRDLTINAIARAEDGTLIDPYGGQRDLAGRCLRHVSESFVEDPVRILRLARFAARFADFSVAPETVALMRLMVDEGEVDALVPERVWQEISRGLMEQQPSRMFAVLRSCGALERIIPELALLWNAPQDPAKHPEGDAGIHVMGVIDYAAGRGFALPVRYAALLHDLGKGTTPAADLPRHPDHEARSASLAAAVSLRLRAPIECQDLAVLVAREHGRIHCAAGLAVEQLVDLLERLDVLRRPERLEGILEAAEADFRARPGYEQKPFEPATLLRSAAAAIRAIDAGAIARRVGPDAQSIKQALHAARVAAVAAMPDAGN
jgi:tRNA nucleotidyltransferase (CCA-adding enzyme)